MTKAELYYQIALAQYQEQHRRSAGFDARAGSMMAVAATLAGIGAVILKSFSGQTIVPPGAIVVTVLLGISFLGVALYAIKGMRPRAWSIDPNPNDLAKHLHLAVGWDDSRVHRCRSYFGEYQWTWATVSAGRAWHIRSDTVTFPRTNREVRR